MNIEKLKEGSSLHLQIETMKGNIKILEWAASDGFKGREMSLNVLGNSQPNGYCFIPKEAAKDICRIVLNQSRVLLAQYEQQFNEL